MSQKELLYFEDAIKHEDSIISYLEYFKDDLDDDLKNYFEKEIKEHNNLRSKLLNELGECIND